MQAARSIRTTTLVVLIVLTIVITIIVMASASLLFGQSFDALEAEQTRLQTLRAAAVIEHSLEDLSATTGDYAFWNTTYAFMADRDPIFVDENFAAESLARIGVDLALGFDTQNQVPILRISDQLAAKTSADELIAHLSRLPALRTVIAMETGASGIVILPTSVLLVSAQPILDNERNGPARGVLIFGRTLSNVAVTDLASQAQLDLHVWRLDDPALPAEAQSLDTIAIGQAPVVTPVNGGKQIAGILMLEDLSGDAALVMRVVSERPIHARGQQVIGYIFGGMLMIGAVFCTIIVSFVDFVVLRRLVRVSNETALISATGDVAQRISVTGRDEVGVLGQSINRMLAALETTQQQLAISRDTATSANRAKSRFLTGMSHELRTPLTTIIGYSELGQMRANEIGDTEIHEDLTSIRAAGKHLLTLINDTLDLAKIEAGRLDLLFEPLLTHDLIADLERTLRPHMRQNGNQLLIDALDAPVLISTDGFRLRQILINLLGNAAKFTSNGTIWLRVDTPDQAHVRLIVEDTGIGMHPHQLANLFADFSQADAQTARQYGGSGLGLALSQRLAQLLGGTIQVTSTPGVGSHFALTIPSRQMADVSTAVPTFGDAA